MSSTHKPALHPPTSMNGGARHTPSKQADSANQRSQFVVAALTMSWQLAVVVLAPVLGGVALDKKFGTAPVVTLIGLAIALIGSAVVMWQTLKAANRLPVPKLTAEQKRAIQNSYEEDDD